MRRFLPLLCLFLSPLAHADVNYSVRVNVPARNFSVTMEVTNPGPDLRFRIPNWCPGFYFLLDYPSRIGGVRAEGPGGTPLPIVRGKDGGYSVPNPALQKVTVRYTVSGNDSGLGFFRSHVRSTSAFINGPAVFMYAEGHMEENHRVRFTMPEGWEIATAMEPSPLGSGAYESPGYDEFIDHPIQMGKIIRKAFTAGGYPFEVAWVCDGRPLANLDEETERLRKASLPALHMFGGAPFKRYVYIVHLEIGDFAGGLEHRASTVMAVANSRTVHLDELATHEFFHTWNVKNIRPKVLGPFDYTKAVRTGNLWWSEGVTDYYAKVHAYQAGLKSSSQFLKMLENDIEDLERSQTAKKLSVEDVSRQCWDHGGFSVGDLSYYTKGCVIGLLLDAEIRSRTEGKKSLDDAMRILMERHALPKPGFEEDGLLELLVEMVGEGIRPVYQALVRSTNPVDYSALKGIGMRLRVPSQRYEKLAVDADASGVIRSVSPSEPNLKPGDRILIANRLDGNTAEVTYMRGSMQAKIRTKLISITSGDHALEFDPFATEEQLARRAEWLAIPAFKG